LLGVLVTIYKKAFQWKKPAVVETYHSVGMKVPSWKRSLHAWLATFRDGLALMALDPYWSAYRRGQKEKNIKFIPNGVNQ